jgi:hypothetical protein
MVIGALLCAGMLNAASAATELRVGPSLAVFSPDQGRDGAGSETGDGATLSQAILPALLAPPADDPFVWNGQGLSFAGAGQFSQAGDRLSWGFLLVAFAGLTAVFSGRRSGRRRFYRA